MKKTKYFIYVFDKGQARAVLVQGYFRYINGVALGVHRAGDAWTVSELTTGCKVCCGRTRKDAFSEAEKMTVLISSKINGDCFKAARETIAAAYKAG